MVAPDGLSYEREPLVTWLEGHQALPSTMPRSSVPLDPNVPILLIAHPRLAALGCFLRGEPLPTGRAASNQTVRLQPAAPQPQAVDAPMPTTPELVSTLIESELLSNTQQILADVGFYGGTGACFGIGTYFAVRHSWWASLTPASVYVGIACSLLGRGCVAKPMAWLRTRWGDA